MQCRKTLRQKLKAFVDSTKILRRSKDNMNKKFLSLVLALVMVLGTLTPVFAEEAPKDKIEKAAKTAPSAKVQWLVDEKIVSGRKLFKDGDEKTELSLDKNLQRDEITRLLVLGKGLENLANLVQGTMRPYVDVDNANWANGVITVGSYHLKNEQGVPMLAGYPGNKFLPTRNVTYAELAKMLVVLVDNTITPKMVENFQWPSDWMVRAARLGILAGVEVKDSNAFVTRQAAFEMLYNALYLYDTAHHVDYGTKMGIVSGYANGELKINQGEKAFTVKLNGSTLYVNNSGYVGKNALQMWNSNQGLWLGSLVRVIADKDGNATHIVELGNPEVGAISGRWFGVADKTVQGLADFRNANLKSGGYITVRQNTWMTQDQLKAYQDETAPSVPRFENVKDVTVRLSSNTRYFVADARNNFLTEVDKDTARDLVGKIGYGDELEDIPNVYVGYDVNNTRADYTEARVVVFNVVKYGNYDDALVRVTNPTNSIYNFYAENTKGEVTEYSTRNFAGTMPGFERPEMGSTNTAGYHREFEKLNVVALDLGLDSKDVLRAGVVIRYATDPSFKVIDQTLPHAGAFYLTLEGQNGVVLQKVLVKDGTKIFTEKDVNNLVGKYIQVAEKDLGKDADGRFYFKNFTMPGVVSVLDHAKNLAKIAPDYGQNKFEVTVEFSKPVEFDKNDWRIKARNVKFNTPLDKLAQDLVPGAEGYYYLSENDAAAVNAALEANKATVTFTGTIVVNRPGQEVRLDIDKLIAPEIKLPEFTENNPKADLDLPEGKKVADLKELTPDQITAVTTALNNAGNPRTFKVENSGNKDGMLIISELDAQGNVDANKVPTSVKISDVAK